RWKADGPSAGVRRQGRAAMRLLLAWDGDGVDRATPEESAPDRGRREACGRGEPVPLRLLSARLRRDARGQRAKAGVQTQPHFPARPCRGLKKQNISGKKRRVSKGLRK